MPGSLTAEREGSDVKLTMSFPDGYDHCFMVERLAGVTDEGEEVWEPIHSGTRKFVYGEVDYHQSSSEGQDQIPDASPGTQETYRALAYALLQAPNVLVTDGAYTDAVTV